MKGWLKYPWLGGAVAALLLSVSVPPAAQAESGDVAALRKEVARLEQIVQRLDARVEQIEKRLPASPETGLRDAAPPAETEPRVSAGGVPRATAGAVPPAVAPEQTSAKSSVQKRWHRISHGMTAQAVEALLGRPQRTLAVNTKTVWYYSYPDIGSGSVVLTQDGLVDDWQSPPFHTWWW